MLKTYAPDPYRPRVRVMVAGDGTRIPVKVDINLWEDESGRAIQAPVDPETVDFDGLSQL